MGGGDSYGSDGFREIDCVLVFWVNVFCHSFFILLFILFIFLCFLSGIIGNVIGCELEVENVFISTIRRNNCFTFRCLFPLKLYS